MQTRKEGGRIFGSNQVTVSKTIGVNEDERPSSGRGATEGNGIAKKERKTKSTSQRGPSAPLMKICQDADTIGEGPGLQKGKEDLIEKAQGKLGGK